MNNDYTYMDSWNDEEVTSFKEKNLDQQYSHTKRKSSTISFFSGNTTIVSEGDSWFDYLPGTDIIDCLRNHHGYDIKNYAKAGDTLENMIYGIGYDNNFQRTTPSIRKVLKKVEKLKPNIFLFSGGGNDIAGDEFASYLNHYNSSLPILREEYIENMIHTVFKKYFEDLIKKISLVSPNTHILTHGYGHTIPTGKGVKFLFFNFSGPWLRPALAMKGIFDPIEQRLAVEKMINEYNKMLSKLSDKHSQFHHLDLRTLLDPNNDWTNELHLKNSAYAKVSNLFHEKIIQIKF